MGGEPDGSSTSIRSIVRAPRIAEETWSNPDADSVDRSRVSKASLALGSSSPMNEPALAGGVDLASGLMNGAALRG
jgi:hypothetical protein